MAKKISGIVIEIDGKTDGLAAALKKANERVNEVSSSLAKVDKALKLDPNNVELLAQKQGLLSEAIAATENKLNTLKKTAEQAEDALAKGAITQGEYEQLQAEVALTTAKLKQLGTEANDTSKRLDDLGEGADGAKGDIKDVGEEAKDSGDKAEKGGEGFSKFGEAVKKGAEVAAAAMAAVVTASVAVTKALVDCSVAGSNYADEILTLSTQTHIAEEDLQAFKYASELVDVSLDTLTGSMAKNVKSMNSAKSGTGAAAEAYKALGVSVVDAEGNLRSSEDVFFESIDALGQIANETERDALAMTLFGKSAFQDLNPLIETGSEAFKAYAKEAEAAGAIMSGDQLDAYGAFNDTLMKLESGSEAAKNALGTILLPTLNSLGTEGVDLLGEFSKGIIAADGDMEEISSVISSVISQAVNALLENMDSIIGLAGSVIGALADALLANLDTILNAAGQIILSLGNGIIEHLPDIISVGLSVITQLALALLQPDNVAMLAQAAVDIITNLNSSLAESVGILIPAMMTAILTLVDTLTQPDNLDKLISTGIELLMQLTFGLIDAIPQLLGAVPTIIGRLLGAILTHLPELVLMGINLLLKLAEGLLAALPDLLTSGDTIISELMKSFEGFGSSLGSKALTWGIDMMKQLIQGIKNKLSAVGEAAKDIASTIASYIGFSLPERGPLHRTDTFMPDMVDVLSDGIKKSLPQMQQSVGQLSSVMAGTLNQPMDYSGALSGISGQLATLGASGQPINVYIGAEKLDTVIAKSSMRSSFRAGGR